MITSFSGEYRWLSNFWYAGVSAFGRIFPTVEHAYQACKSMEPVDWQKIAWCKTPGDAKRAGRTLKIREDWDQIKLFVMEELLIQKFQHPHLRQLLLDTGDQEIVEGNTWGDTFWGVCNGVGENHLGKLIMKIRTMIRNGEL